MEQSILLLSVIAVAVLPCRLPAADDLNIEFNDRGPASIIHHGVELLAANQPGFRLRDLNFVDLRAKDRYRQVYEPKLVSKRFDPDKKTLVQQYVECREEIPRRGVPDRHHDSPHRGLSAQLSRRTGVEPAGSERSRGDNVGEHPIRPAALGLHGFLSRFERVR